MEPAQQNAIVCMSWATIFGRVDVMNFAPRGGDVAAGDAAFPIPQGDRSTLLRGEAAFGRTHVDDAAVVVEHDPLDTAIAGVLLDHPHGNRGIQPVDVPDSPVVVDAGVKVGQPNTDHDGRCRATHRGCLGAACGCVDNARENVMALLFPRARVPFQIVCSQFFRVEKRGRRARRRVCIHEGGELRGDIRDERTTNRHEPVLLPPDRERAHPQGTLLDGEAAILVQPRLPHLGVNLRVIGGAGVRRFGCSAGGRGDEFKLRGLDGERIHHGRNRGEPSNDEVGTVESEAARCERLRHMGKRRGHLLPHERTPSTCIAPDLQPLR